MAAGRKVSRCRRCNRAIATWRYSFRRKVRSFSRSLSSHVKLSRNKRETPLSPAASRRGWRREGGDGARGPRDDPRGGERTRGGFCNCEKRLERYGESKERSVWAARRKKKREGDRSEVAEGRRNGGWRPRVISREFSRKAGTRRGLRGMIEEQGWRVRVRMRAGGDHTEGTIPRDRV